MKPASPRVPGAFALSILQVACFFAASPLKCEAPFVASNSPLRIVEPIPGLDRVSEPGRPALAGNGQVRPIRKTLLSGTVVRPDGSPVAGAIVDVYPVASLSRIVRVVANSRGEFEVMVADAPCVVSARGAGLPPKGKVVADPSDPAFSGLRMTLEPGGFALTGKVVGPNGNPIPRGEVWIQDFGSMDESRVCRADLVSGKFRVNLPKGDYRVTVRSRGYADVREVLAIDGATSRSFTMGKVPSAPSFEVKNWLRGHAIPIRTLEPEGPMDDLRPIGAMIGDAKIVGIGESTHGTHEFFSFKHRMVEYLVREKGFSLLLVEEDFGQTALVDDYVRFGKGDPESAVAGLDVEFWKTEEMVKLVRWMREYNADPAHAVKVGFCGIDARNPYAPYRQAMAGLIKVDPALAAEIEKSGLDDAFVRNVRDDLRNVPLERRARGLAGARRLVEAIRTLEGRMAEDEFTRLRVSASMACQFFEIYSSRTSNEVRDRVMLDNIELIRQERGVSAKAVLWAHNGHIQHWESPLGGKTLGENLRGRFGEDYVALATSFNHGGFRAWDIVGNPQRGMVSTSVKSAPSGSFASAMSATGLKCAVVNLRSVPTSGPIGAWFRELRPEWMIGGTFCSTDPSYWLDSSPMVMSNVADIVMFVDRTTPARPQPEFVMPFDLKTKDVLPVAANLDFGSGVIGQPPDGWETSTCWGFPKVEATSSVLLDAQGVRFVALAPQTTKDPYRITVLAQAIDGTPYRGRTLRFSAEVRDDDRVKGKSAYGALWIRSDAPSGGGYEVRPLPEGGSNGWRRVSVTLRVAADANILTYGFRCGGEGNDHVGMLIRKVALEPASR